MLPTSPPFGDDEEALGDLAAALGALRGEPAASPAEIHALFELSREMMVIAGFDGFFKLVSPAWTATLGHTRAELCAVPFLDFVHPDDREVTRTVAERLTHNGRLVSFQNRYRHRDGSYRAISWRATVSVERQRIYAVASDVSEQVAARETEAILALVLEGASDAVIVVDAGGGITRWSVAAERLCGWTAAEVVGRSLLEVAGPRVGAVTRRALVGGDGADPTDGLFLHKNGQEIQVTMMVTPFGAGGRDSTGAVALVRPRAR